MRFVNNGLDKVKYSAREIIATELVKKDSMPNHCETISRYLNPKLEIRRSYQKLDRQIQYLFFHFTNSCLFSEGYFFLEKLYIDIFHINLDK